MLQFLFKLFIINVLINSLPASASEAINVKAHYYVPDQLLQGKYKDLITWPIANENEWANFVNNVNKSNENTEPVNPMVDIQPALISITQTHADLISYDDYYISQNGIMKVSAVPMDQYYVSHDDFRKFLEAEMAKKTSFDTATTNIDVKTPGIVVVYNSSDTITKPSWVVTDADELIKYTTLFENREPLNGENLKSAKENYDYNGKNTYFLYLNYPYAPCRMITVTEGGYFRQTNIDIKEKYLLDGFGYFKYFKNQAQQYYTQKIKADREKAKSLHERDKF